MVNIMAFKGWEKIDQPVESNEELTGERKIGKNLQLVKAVAPVIISASRSTDIPVLCRLVHLKIAERICQMDQSS